VAVANELDDAIGTALACGGVHVVDVRSSADASPTTKVSRQRSGAYS
jgi:hypothetical protein